ncbi:MAG: hypothetical protein ACR2OC_04300 [Solirubrobacterales bacterium]
MLLALVIAGCGGGDEPSTAPPKAPGAGVPDGAVAQLEGVDGGVITEELLEQTVAEDALEQGETSPPSPASPEYALYAGAALDDLLLALWVAAEAAERGVSADQLEQELREQGGTEELSAKWAPRTECLAEVVARLCGGSVEPDAPPDLPPASG